MFVNIMLILISIQVAILTVMIAAYIRWRKRQEKDRNSALAENLRLTLQRKQELEQLRAGRYQ